MWKYRYVNDQLRIDLERITDRLKTLQVRL